MRGAFVASTLLAILVIPIVSLAATDLDMRAQPSDGSRTGAWVLGVRLSQVAIDYSNGAPQQEADKELASLRVGARLLGVSIPPFPSRSGDRGQDHNKIIGYLRGVESSIGNELNLGYPPDHAALFRLGLNCTILQFVYRPEDPYFGISTPIARIIGDLATTAGLPKSFWEPLLNKVDQKASREEVVIEGDKMNADIKNYFTEKLNKLRSKLKPGKTSGDNSE